MYDAKFNVLMVLTSANREVNLGTVEGFTLAERIAKTAAAAWKNPVLIVRLTEGRFDPDRRIGKPDPVMWQVAVNGEVTEMG